MGRGLSTLQRHILLAIPFIHGNPEPHDPRIGPKPPEQVPGLVRLSLLKMTLWGLRRSCPDRRGDIGPIFDPDAIGRARYNSIKATLDKALKRLEQRGLLGHYNGAVSHWSGVALTETGRALVRDWTAAGVVLPPALQENYLTSFSSHGKALMAAASAQQSPA